MATLRSELPGCATHVARLAFDQSHVYHAVAHVDESSSYVARFYAEDLPHPRVVGPRLLAVDWQHRSQGLVEKTDELDEAVGRASTGHPVPVLAELVRQDLADLLQPDVGGVHQVAPVVGVRGRHGGDVRRGHVAHVDDRQVDVRHHADPILE